MKENTVFHLLLATAVALTTLVLLLRFMGQTPSGASVQYHYPAAEAPTVTTQSPIATTASRTTAPPTTEGAATTQKTVQFPLDLNTADYDELCLIPRIGDVTAQRILQYRAVLGGYTSLEQLMEIQGIGEKTFEAIAPYLIIGA